MSYSESTIPPPPSIGTVQSKADDWFPIRKDG